MIDDKYKRFPYWYKNTRSYFKVAVIYNFLRYCGFKPHIARRIRYWSMNHIIRFIKTNYENKAEVKK